MRVSAASVKLKTVHVTWHDVVQRVIGCGTSLHVVQDDRTVLLRYLVLNLRRVHVPRLSAYYFVYFLYNRLHVEHGHTDFRGTLSQPIVIKAGHVKAVSNTIDVLFISYPSCVVRGE